MGLRTYEGGEHQRIAGGLNRRARNNLATVCRRKMAEWFNAAEWAYREWRRKRLPVMKVSFDRDLARKAGMEESDTIYDIAQVEMDVSFGRQDRKHLNWLKGLEPVIRVPGMSGVLPDLGDRSTVVLRCSDTYDRVTVFLELYEIPWTEILISGKGKGRQQASAS